MCIRDSANALRVVVACCHYAGDVGAVVYGSYGARVVNEAISIYIVNAPFYDDLKYGKERYLGYPIKTCLLYTSSSCNLVF